MKTHIGHDMSIQPGFDDEALVNIRENMCRDSDTLRANGCLAATYSMKLYEHPLNLRCLIHLQTQATCMVLSLHTFISL